MPRRTAKQNGCMVLDLTQARIGHARGRAGIYSQCHCHCRYRVCFAPTTGPIGHKIRVSNVLPSMSFSIFGSEVGIVRVVLLRNSFFGRFYRIQRASYAAQQRDIVVVRVAARRRARKVCCTGSRASGVLSVNESKLASIVHSFQEIV
jgi:hypothetical protein